MKLYTYFRSGAAWRVRIGLNWKGVPYEAVPMDLRTGAQASPEWKAVNPQGLVPALELDDGTVLTQSLAILEWLEETHPQPAFLPADPLIRAKIRAVSLAIAADTHPIQNLGTLKRIETLTNADTARQWAHDTIAHGLAAVETWIARNPGPYAFGAQPTLADILIVPQLTNAARFKVDLTALPRIREVNAACAELPAFQNARPEVQPDAD
ncbi:maleylacetoacetate isomerase [Sandaracinobacteroides hominis]|uniref:maleylacetoacetate isomerase n=1 Tax=Sandaracinobacteroides hominis TaxID=2780086 RepID=UPI0018F7B12A|nr:maleylacetoacetate isomerase [Sandaracinobacteroides hominis]